MGKKQSGCLMRLGLGTCVVAALMMFGIIFGMVAMIGGGDQGGTLDPNIPNGNIAAVPPPAPPCLCSPTPVITPTPLPSATLMPTWPLPPTPNPGRPPDPPPPPAPNQTPPPDLTATAAAYNQAEQEWDATATAEARNWQQTVVAGYATQTALVPTATPIPPTPVGGGPWGWPVDPACTAGHSDCVNSPDGTRYVTQDYGCTWLSAEDACPWCTHEEYSQDYRWRAGGQGRAERGTGGQLPSEGGISRNPGDIWNHWHTGIDLATGLGEPYWATLDGVITLAGYDQRGPSYGYGLHIIIQDPSGLYGVLYGHMSQLGEAVDINTGRDRGRKWQVGDRIRPLTASGQRIIVGYSGSSGNSSGNHLHFTVFMYGRQGGPMSTPGPTLSATLLRIHYLPLMRRFRCREKEGVMPHLIQHNHDHTSLRRCWGIAIVIALLLTTLGPCPSLAQSGGRLRVVVRTVQGQGIAGIQVRIDQRAIDESVFKSGFASGVTDQRGVVDFDTQSPSPWPTGGYQLRFLSGNSARPIMSLADQDIIYPPLAVEIRSESDDWAMYVLDYQGNLLPDYSLSLLAPPQLHAPNVPTPAPLSINQALVAHGLPTVGPHYTLPTPGGPVAAAATTDALSSASPLAGRGDSNNLLWLITTLILVVAWFGRRRINRIISARPQPGLTDNQTKPNNTSGNPKTKRNAP